MSAAAEIGNWLRYRLFRAVALPRPVWDDSRYPRTIGGGWRYFREWVASGEVEFYERNHRR
ncbi:hypothetical protein [Plantactinospora sp. WMMB782]|uniref:hypothetical protein n=1 Tax=Plantactinospora sp. WMMB782 TaxID=3404121 RepID=UPI003B94BF3E